MILRQNPGIPGITHPVLAANQTVYQNNSSSLLAQNIFKQFFLKKIISRLQLNKTLLL